MIIKKAQFVLSNSDYKKCPKPTMPEYAFIGRSNVGKSSLINMLTNNSKLAKTSGKPGKTQLINHFIINDNWYLVDLPGYGYAKVSKSDREKWGKMIYDYITQRENLYNIFVLVDSRIPPQSIDMEFINWLGENGIPFAIIYTKTDKLSKNKVAASIAAFKRELSKDWEELPPQFITSSVTKAGKDDLLSYIEEINKNNS
ncbi:MAG: ribosome biogenesis GTP-binding protein YihA/YsxC [bacterium]|nr:ribosome biogenesis GTP-binding protein YihA/YsxC [bacterium]